MISSPSKNRDKHHKSSHGERERDRDRKHGKSNGEHRKHDHKSQKRSRDDSRDHDRTPKKHKWVHNARCDNKNTSCEKRNSCRSDSFTILPSFTDVYFNRNIQISVHYIFLGHRFEAHL